MNASRAKRLARASLTAAFAAVMSPGVAFAQDAPPGPLDLSAPIRLEPSGEGGVGQPARPPSPYERPTYAQPATDDAVMGTAVTGAENAPVIGGMVEAETLGAINPDVAGVLNETEGGFGSAMWLGTRGGVIEHLLPQVPVTTASPATRELIRRGRKRDD